MKSLLYEKQNNKLATRGAQFVHFRIQNYLGNTIRRHKHSDKSKVYTFYGL